MRSDKSFASRLSIIIIFLNYWLPPFAYAALIFYLSSLPGTTYFPQFFSADKLLHLGEYGILGYLLARALGCCHLRKKILFITAFSGCLVYGISDELHQLFVPHRCTSIMDVIADGVGSFTGIWIYNKQKGIL